MVDQKYTVEEALGHGVSKAAPGKTRRVLLSSFVVSFFVLANLISFSHYPQYKEALLQRFEPYSAALGIGQNWTMFAPDTRKLNFHSTALIEFEDGSLRLLEFPRFDLMDTASKFKHAKLRKLFNDYMVNQIGEKYRPSIARFYLMSVYDRKNPPRKLTIDFHFRETKDPTKDGVIDRRASYRQHLKKSTIFIYRVREKDRKLFY